MGSDGWGSFAKAGREKGRGRSTRRLGLVWILEKIFHGKKIPRWIFCGT